MRYEYREQMVSYFSTQPKLFGGCSMSMLLQNSGTRLPQLMNTSGFHQNVGEGNKSLNAMSPDPLLSEAFGKGSGCAILDICESVFFLYYCYTKNSATTKHAKPVSTMILNIESSNIFLLHTNK